MRGTQVIGGTVLLLTLALAVALALPAAAQEGTVTRGGNIAVTVIGSPRTAYDIWVGGTSDMTGERGDQPPVIVPGQVDVQQDDPDGPYTIGNTHIVTGGGTILQDVAPTSSVVPATSYYALVTTNIDGSITVLFRTSADTATDRQFHIKAQNPVNTGENVQVILGAPAPAPTPVPTPMIPLPFPTTVATPFVPPPTTPVPATNPIPPMAVLPTAPLVTPSPEETPMKTAPVQGIPLPPVIAVTAAGLGVLVAGAVRRTR